MTLEFRGDHGKAMGRNWHLLAGLLFLFLIMIWGASDYGITWDERFQQVRAERILSFYLSGFKDTRILNDRYYGTFFELLCAIAQKAFSGLPPYYVRHLLNCLFGFTGIAACVLLAQRLFGVSGGFFCLFLFYTSPRYLAHCINNSKDIPFATMVALSLSLMLQIKRTYPYVTKRLGFALATCAGLCLSLRMAGLFIFVYCAGILLVHGWRERISSYQLTRVTGFFLMGVVGALLVAGVFWPSLIWTSKVAGSLPTVLNYPDGGGVLFFGKWIVNKSEIPWYYAPVYSSITLPLAVLIPGFFSFALLRRSAGSISIPLLLIAAFFPLAFVVVARVPLYNEVRHLLFTYPPMVVLAAGVWASVWSSLRSRTGYRVAFLACLAGALYHPLRFQIANHPNGIVYFNQIIGGVNGAFKQFDLDYWGNCFKQGVDWLHLEAKNKQTTITYFVASGGHVAREYSQKYSNLRFVKPSMSADYWLRVVRGSPGTLDTVLKGLISIDFPRAKHLTAIRADGVPLCVIQLNQGTHTRNNQVGMLGKGH